MQLTLPSPVVLMQFVLIPREGVWVGVVVPMVIPPDGNVRLAVVAEDEARKPGGFFVMI